MIEIETRAPQQIDSIDPLDFLVIAPHPDDAELGMGGTIAKMSSLGMRVGILDLTSGEPTPFGDEATRRKETIKATQPLGVVWRGNAGMTNRALEATLENRATLAGYFRKLRPRWLFAPYWTDAHPDHVAATKLVEDARFWSKLSKTDLPGERFHPERVFYYYCIHLKLAIQPAFIVDISDHWEKKHESLQAYESQFVKGRDPGPPSFVERFRINNAYLGNLIGKDYGEGFSSHEPIALDSLKGLI